MLCSSIITLKNKQKFVKLLYVSHHILLQTKSCHSAMCLPGEHTASFQCLNALPAAHELSVIFPISLFFPCFLSFIIVTMICMSDILLLSAGHDIASLKIGEELHDFFFVRSFAITLSFAVMVIFAIGS